jgi:hypothetical protein
MIQVSPLSLAPGKCRVCGCSELNPCLYQIAQGEPLAACAWMDFDHTLCSNFRCIAEVPLAELEEMPLFRRRVA